MIIHRLVPIKRHGQPQLLTFKLMSKALYQDDTYQFDCQAVIQKVSKVAEEENGTGEYEVTLDQTVFYPQGGGQPSDKGEILSESNGVFSVQKVTKNRETMEIVHRGTFKNEPFNSGTMVKCQIDKELRLLHARYHSAGHVLDLALIALQVYDKWWPKSGNHAPAGAYVEYSLLDMSMTAEDVKSLMDKVESVCNDLLKRDLKNFFVHVDPSEIPSGCLRMTLNSTNKSLEKLRINRVESFDDYWTPCGGTLCSRLGEIGSISIPKYSFKKGILKIYYTVA